LKSTDEIQRLSVLPAQSAIWFAQMLDATSAALNIAEYVEIEGPLDVAIFESALRRIISETDALHFRVRETVDGLRQFHEATSDWSLPYFDVSAETDPEKMARLWMEKDRENALDISRDPLFLYALFRVAPNRFFWYARYHHICMDGFGGALVARRVAEVYSALAAQHDVPAGNFCRYAELLDEEAEYHETYREPDQKYWRELLSDRPGPVTLSGKQPERSNRFIRCTGYLPRKLAKSLTHAGKLNGASFAQVVEAASALFLHRLTGAWDLLLGIPVTARIGRNMRRVPGPVSNILPLRLAFSPRDAFSSLLTQVALRKQEMLRRQRYRIPDLRRDLGLSPADPEIYGMLVNVMPFSYDSAFAGCAAKTHNLSNGPVYELSVVLYDRQDGRDLRLDFDANPAHYTLEQLKEYQQRFLMVLEQAVHPDRPVHSVSVLLPNECATIVKAFNSTSHALPDITLPVLLERVVEHSPNATAVVFEEQQLSYAQLNARANQWAWFLARMGVGPESRVGILLPRSLEMLMAMLAVLKAGGAYVPLDPEYPQARIKGMLEDARPQCVLTNSKLKQMLPAETSALSVDTAAFLDTVAREGEGNLSDAERSSALLPQHAAYVIYTSGSTGRPKGVVIEHRSVTSFIAWAGSVYRREEWDGVVASTSICFDLSIFELFATLSHGGRVLLVQSAVEVSGMAAREQVRLINTVPSAARALLESSALPRSMRTINLAGEALPNRLVQELYELGHVERVYNLYGPTEDTTYSTFTVCRRGVEEEPTIGSPVWNTRAYVLDGYLQPQPIGAAGELYLTGDGTARGYFGQPGGTAERFVADPFGAGGSRMYRTGDLARWRKDGSLEFLGRADRQVKVRGFRIELSEIEKALRASGEIGNVAVIVHDGSPGGQEIVAYVTAANGTAPDAAALRRSLSEQLPRYMIPAAIVALDALPLTPNGKLDRKALPAPVREEESYRAPRNREEEALCEMFARILSLERVGIDDNFFRMGGHSLSAMRLASRIRARFGVDLNVSDLYVASTVKDLSVMLRMAADTCAAIDGSGTSTRDELFEEEEI
jgi:nonribosomal peptide synthetase DhbF